MYCLYLIITVYMTGVLLATDGKSADCELTDSGIQKRSAGELPVAADSSHRQNQKTPNKIIKSFVQIHYRNRGMICSGALLTNLMVLTTANCAQNRELGKLRVILQLENSNSTFQLGVREIRVHPNNTHKNRENNVAILVFHLHFKRDMELLLLPHERYTTNTIIESRMQTYVYQWGHKVNSLYTSHYEKLPITSDFRLCGALGVVNNTLYYCVNRKGHKYKYKRTDLGSPLFYFNASDQYLLGIYTGHTPKDSIPGTLYQSIYQSIDWIKYIISGY